MLLDRLDRQLAESGLGLRGGLDFTASDETPILVSGRLARGLVLVGHGGGAFWEPFEGWRSTQPRDVANPLDCWSRAVIEGVAADWGLTAVFPSDRPYWPFQQWAMRAEGLRQSPLGVLMHPLYGPWHAYRGALLSDEPFGFARAIPPVHPCDYCAEKPCLGACPVGAHALQGFAYHRCLDHVRSAVGEPCRTDGCFDRNACPVGTDYRYPREMQEFLMAAFAR